MRNTNENKRNQDQQVKVKRTKLCNNKKKERKNRQDKTLLIKFANKQKNIRRPGAKFLFCCFCLNK